MQRRAIVFLTVILAACAPAYVWGSEDRVRRMLMKMLPEGSAPAQLLQMANRRGWKVDTRNTRVWPLGTKTYLDRRKQRCRSSGGLAVPTIIAHYSAPFDTYVEALWLFDREGRLRDVCVRKSVDAL